MSSVDQLVGHTIMDGGGLNSCEIKLVVYATDEDKPVRGYFQYFLSAYGGCSVPISQGVAVSPCRL